MGRQDIAGKRAFAVDPRGMLHLVGRLDLSADAAVTVASPELLVPPKIADLVFRVDAGGGSTVEILEALACWDEREVDRIAARYAAAMLIPEYRPRAIFLTVMLLERRALSDRLPETFVIDREGGRLNVYPRYVRMWEGDPLEVLRMGRPALLPWVALMDAATEDQVEHAGHGVEHDEELWAHFTILAGLRYEGERLAALLRRFAQMMTVQIAEQTPLGKQLMERGIERGIEQGERHASEEAVKRFLRHRYPAIESEFTAEGLDTQALQLLLDSLFDAPDEVAARRALAAAKP